MHGKYDGKRARRIQPLHSPGDTLANGVSGVYLTIEYTKQTSYKFTNGDYMPITLVDKFWELADDTEIED